MHTYYILPYFLYELSQSIFNEPMSKCDNTLLDEFRNHLNESLGVPFSGVDLAALNIQRGRDHGLPGFTHFQNFCLQDRLKREPYVEYSASC